MTDEATRAVTTAEGVLRLSVHQQTVQRLIRAGELRAVRIGRVWRVPVDALGDYLARRPAENAEVER